MGSAVARFQVVRDSDGRRWVVVDFEDDGGTVVVADPGDDWVRRRVDSREFARTYTPESAGGVPVWGY